MATIKQRGKSWQLNWSENGQYHRKSLGQIPKSEAQRIKTQKEYELGQGSVSSPYFDYFAAEYLDWYEANYPASFDRCRSIIVNHLSPIFGQLMISQINGRMIKDYQISRKDVATATYLKEFRCLKAMLNRAVEWEHLDKNPISHIRPPKDNNSKPPHFYTKDQLQEIYKISNYRWQWQFVANTGLRLSEALSLDLSSDIRDNSVFVLSTNESRTKSGKWREIPLFDGAKEALNKLDNPMLNVHPKSVSRIFKKDLKKVGLEGSFHSLRHTFISHLAMSGKFSMTEIQAWAGHQSITTTQRYSHLVPNYRKIDTSTLNI